MDLRGEEVVRRVLAVVGGDAPLDEAEEFLAPDVGIYMDGKQVAKGIKPWRKWLRFLRRQKPGLTLAVGEVSANENGEVCARAKWKDKSGAESAEGEVVYFVKDGKVAAIRTKRANYVFVLGRRFAESRPFFWLALLRVALSRD